jgi:hypothetical protein
MRALFRLMSLLRTARAAAKGKLAHRLVRMRLFRFINKRISEPQTPHSPTPIRYGGGGPRRGGSGATLWRGKSNTRRLEVSA